MTDSRLDQDGGYSRFLQMLPWYLNKTLSVEDSRWMQSYLNEHPSAKDDLEFYSILSNETVAAVEAVPTSIGRGRLMERIRQYETTARNPVNVAGGNSFMSWIQDFLSFFSAPKLAWGMAIIAAVQSGYIYQRLHEESRDGSSEFRSLGPRALPVLRVQFKEAATEREISRLLVQSDAVIVGGPSQLGEYEVTSRSGDTEGLKSNLMRSDIVEFVADKGN